MDDDVNPTGGGEAEGSTVLRVANAGTSVDVASDAGGGNECVVAVNGVTLGTPVPVDRAATPYAATGTIPPLPVDPTLPRPAVPEYTWALQYGSDGWSLITLGALGDVIW